MKKDSVFLNNSSHLPACVLLLCLFSSVNIQAQDSVVVHKKYTIYRDAAITSLQENYRRYNALRDFSEGYRIQISYTNVRDEVYKSKASMYVQFPELSSYVEYEQPYYKLRLGDFKTRLQATHYLQEIIPLYPGAFIVKDRIKNK